MIANALNKLLKVTETSPTSDTVDVASTCLNEVSYDMATMVLTVTFVESGNSYNYYGVSEGVYEDLVNNFGSVGETYNETIKGVYPYTRV
jgi:hypothetical protein